MKSKKINNGYIIRLEKGEEIIELLTKFCKNNKIKSGIITGIGGTDNACLKYYDLEKKEYLSKKFSGKNYEIVSLNGNISLIKNEPFMHIHAV
ncbi:MAG: PPC domain-containing DNA-binding protein, partial [Candidatus Woesearchaeota archaeon]